MNRYYFVLSFLLISILVGHSNAPAQSIDFELDGMGGAGISAANEPADVVDGGSGDIGSTGISVNLSSLILSIDIEWGSGNGHTDLSSDVDFMNIHGPTTQTAPDNFVESAGSFTGLDGFDPSATNGGFVGQVKLSQGNVRQLLEGRFYLHLHTFVNGDGEARGYMIPEVVVGDTNGDGAINLLDVDSFVAAVVDGTFFDEADINQDGDVNLLDVNPFIALLSG